MKFIGIIPARYSSSRFPGKPLALLGGKPVIQWVCERAATVLDNVWVATDDDRIAEAVKNFAGTGLSILEISHRSKEFSAVIEEAAAMVKELLEVPEGYHVLFLGGGASLQFCMVPYNLLNTKAAYLDTGTWANKAIKEARLFGEVDVVASSKEANYTFIPKDYTIPADADYFHVTTNNTIYGHNIDDV